MIQELIEAFRAARLLRRNLSSALRATEKEYYRLKKEEKLALISGDYTSIDSLRLDINGLGDRLDDIMRAIAGVSYFDYS